MNDESDGTSSFDGADLESPCAERQCAEDDCSTVLSRYNEGEFCAWHQPMVTPRTRGAKIA